MSLKCWFSFGFADESEPSDGTKENDAKEVIKPSKVRAMAASLNNTNTGEL